MDFYGEMFHMLSSGAGIAVGVGLDIFLLVVSLTVVKRNRPEVAKWFISSAALGLVTSTVMPIANALAANFGWDLLGADSIHNVFAVVGLLGTIMGGLAFALLIIGIAKIAKPRTE